MILGKEHEIPRCPCIECGKPLNAATGVNNYEAPTDGMISICCYCGHIGIFTTNGSIREPTVQEYADAVRHPEVVEALSTIAQVKVKQ